jgi:TP901 family phage tail tape measure protein
VASVIRNLLIALNMDVSGVDKGSKKAQESLTGIDKAVAKVGQVGTAIASAGSSLTQKVTLPLAGIAGTALKMGGDFEASMNKVRAVTGATGGEFDKLKELAKKLGSETQYSASEAADAMYFLSSAGFKTNEILQALPGTLNLAAAGNMDLATAADIASNVLSGYGFKASEIGKVNDVMAKTFTMSNVDIRMLGETFKYVGPIAKSAGLQFEEIAAATGLLGNAGIQGSEAGTALRGAIARLIQPTKAVAVKLKELGVNVTDSKGNLLPLVKIFGQLEKAGASTADIVTIFGVEAGPGMAAILQQGTGALRNLTKELESSGGTAERIAKVQMEGLNGGLKGLRSAFEGLMIAVAESGLLEAATQFVGKVTEWTQGLSKANPQMLRMAVVVGAVLAVVGPLLLVLGKMISVVGAVGGAVAKTAVGVGKFGAMLGHGAVAGARGAASAWDTLRLRAMYAGDAIRGVGPKVSSAAGAVRSGAVAAGQYALELGKSAVAATRAGLASAAAATRTVALSVAQKAAALGSKALAAGTWLVNVAMRANPIGIVITAIVALVAAIVVAYKRSETFRNIVQAVWRSIQVAVSAAWKNVLQPALTWIRDFIVKTLAPRLIWFHVTVVRPVMAKVGQAVATARQVVGGALEWIRNLIVNVIAPRFLWFHFTIVRPVMAKIGEIIRTVVGRVRDSFMTLHRLITQTIPNAFRTGVAAVGRFWDNLVGIAKAPVNFVIRLHNQGVGKMINKLAEFVGINARVPAIPYFAAGGVLPGYAPGRDTMLAAVSPGESIFRPEFTRAVGASWVGEANRVARQGGPSAVRQWLTGADALGGEGLAFARGGVVPFAGRYAFGGIIGRFIKGVKDFTIGNVAKGARALLDKIFSAAVPASGQLRTLITAVPRWIKEKVLAWVKAKVDVGGGPGVERALAFARAQAGKPYVWGGVGPGGYDCSGFMSALVNVIKGRSPYSRLFTTFSFTGAQNGPQGFVRNLRSGFTVGVTNAGVGHMAGTLAGRVNVESRGSRGVLVGSGARGAGDGLFPMRYGLKFDDGGVLPPGRTYAYNGTGRPEYVFTQRQMAAMRSGEVISITVNVPPTADKAAIGREIADMLREYKRRGGRMP